MRPGTRLPRTDSKKPPPHQREGGERRLSHAEYPNGGSRLTGVFKPQRSCHYRNVGGEQDDAHLRQCAGETRHHGPAHLACGARRAPFANRPSHHEDKRCESKDRPSDPEQEPDMQAGIRRRLRTRCPQAGRHAVAPDLGRAGGGQPEGGHNQEQDHRQALQTVPGTAALNRGRPYGRLAVTSALARELQEQPSLRWCMSGGWRVREISIDKENRLLQIVRPRRIWR